MPGNPFEFPPNKLVENPGGWTILIHAFDQFDIEVFLKHLASTQLFIFDLAFCHQFCKYYVRDDTLNFAKCLVGNKVGGVRVIVPVVPVFAALAFSLSEEEDGGSPAVCLMFFEFENTN